MGHKVLRKGKSEKISVILDSDNAERLRKYQGSLSEVVGQPVSLSWTCATLISRALKAESAE
jgi:hypothetical protein